MRDYQLLNIPNHLLKIDDLHVFISKDATGNEGIPAISLPNGMILPMVCADQDRVNALRSYAQDIAETTGTEIKLVRFSNREVVEIIVPAKAKN